MTTRMMFINLANAYKKSGKGDKCKSTLAEMDWSASSDLFALALASLREEFGAAAKLIRTLAIAEKLRAADFREWPIFDWIRGNDEVAKSFEEGFGEPLMIESGNVPDGAAKQLASSDLDEALLSGEDG